MSILVAGASTGIGNALVAALRARSDEPVYTISRSDLGQHNLQIDLSDASNISAVQTFLASIQPTRIFCCAGILHDDTHMPEKMLSQIQDDWVYESFSKNVLTHIHLAQALAPVLTKTSSLKWLSLSAKVGSLDDNALGGWYSYRMSKTALNMFIKNLSIEWGRKSPEIYVASLHPGTTDSELSKPFHKNISPDRLYSAEQTATRLIDVMDQFGQAEQGKLLNWDGTVIAY
jgi:NAD(P)-dependent dehydrogenase (short-subunit alcohol dehydrogenase family)